MGQEQRGPTLQDAHAAAVDGEYYLALEIAGLCASDLKRHAPAVTPPHVVRPSRERAARHLYQAVRWLDVDNHHDAQQEIARARAHLESLHRAEGDAMHVYQVPDGGWAVAAAGVITDGFDTAAEAREHGRALQREVPETRECPGCKSRVAVPSGLGRMAVGCENVDQHEEGVPLVMWRQRGGS